MPTEPSLWWRDDMAEPVRVTESPYGHGLWWQRPGMRGPSHVTDDSHWLAPVLTAEQASALTARAERAERERDEARRWAEAAAADENANAAELREVRATLDAIAALVGDADVLERVRELVAAEERLDAVERAGYV